MAIQKGEYFAQQDVYIDYPFEEVMYRWDHKAEKIYIKFYGEEEKTDPVPYNNTLFNESPLNNGVSGKKRHAIFGSFQ